MVAGPCSSREANVCKNTNNNKVERVVVKPVSRFALPDYIRFAIGLHPFLQAECQYRGAGRCFSVVVDEDKKDNKKNRVRVFFHSPFEPYGDEFERYWSFYKGEFGVHRPRVKGNNSQKMLRPSLRHIIMTGDCTGNSKTPVFLSEEERKENYKILHNMSFRYVSPDSLGDQKKMALKKTQGKKKWKKTMLKRIKE